jgi:glutathione peroxidase
MKTAAMVFIIFISGCVATPKENQMTLLYDIKVETIDGKSIKLDAYRGKTMLIVNTASRCGFTGQYDGLQQLYEMHKDDGLVVLGFPSNDFLRQEPGSNEEIASFCRVNYGVTFPMFAKVSVKGKEQHPLFIYLTSDTSNPEFGGRITWNFNKFLISREGKVINRFGSRTRPDDNDLVAAIRNALAQ